MIEREAKVIAGTIAAGEVASVAIAWMFSAPWYGALIAASGAAVFFTGVGIVLAFADAIKGNAETMSTKKGVWALKVIEARQKTLKSSPSFDAPKSAEKMEYDALEYAQTCIVEVTRLARLRQAARERAKSRAQNDFAGGGARSE